MTTTHSTDRDLDRIHEIVHGFPMRFTLEGLVGSSARFSFVRVLRSLPDDACDREVRGCADRMRAHLGLTALEPEGSASEAVRSILSWLEEQIDQFLMRFAGDCLRDHLPGHAEALQVSLRDRFWQRSPHLEGPSAI